MLPLGYRLGVESELGGKMTVVVVHTVNEFEFELGMMMEQKKIFEL